MNHKVSNLHQTLKYLQERASGKPKEIHFWTHEGEDWVLDDFDEIQKAKDVLDRLDFQKRMETESLDVSMLSEAFSKLPKLATLIFEYTDDPPGSVDLTDMGFEVFNTGIPWRCHVFQTFLQALARARCKPQRIMWQNEAVWKMMKAEGLPIWAFNDLNLLIDQAQMSHLLSNLRVLHLERTWHGVELALSAVDDILPDCALGNFVELCPQLEELYLEFGEYYDECTSRNLMGRNSHKNLRKLTFKCLAIDLPELVHCLVRNESLEVVSLGYVLLTSSDWLRFLDYLRRTPLRRLRSLQLSSLTTNTIGKDWGWNDEEQDLLDYIHGMTEINPYKKVLEDWSHALN